MTDGNEATATGEGIAPASTTAFVTIDLGAVYRGTVFVYEQVRNGVAGGTTSTAIFQSDDNANFSQCSAGVGKSGTTLKTVRQGCVFWGRYISVICAPDAVSTGKCTIYEVYLKQYE